MSIGELFKSAGNTVFSKYGRILATFLVYLALVWIMAFLCVNPTIGIIVAIAMYIIIVPLQFGFIKQLILIRKGEKVSAFDFIVFAFDKFGMTWKVTGRLFLKYLGVSVLIIISYVIMAIGIAASSISLISGSASVGTAALCSLLGTIGIFISSIWAFILSLKYTFVYNELVYNDKAETGREIVETVASNMEGYKGKLFLIELVTGILAYVIAMLGLIPVVGLLIILALIFVYIPILQYIMIIFYENVRSEKMPKYEVVEDTNFGMDDEPQDPIQNI